MRVLALLLCLAQPAGAWTFTPLPICTIASDDETVEVTFDPATGLYAIHLTRAEGWPPGPVFALRFEGAAPLTISTDRHRIDGPRLTVTDRGFGNVLAGMERNARATALIADLAVPIDLAGAADPVARFRDCPSDGLV
jgi:hypothetical protein